MMHVQTVIGAFTLALTLVGCTRPDGDDVGETGDTNNNGESSTSGTTGPNPSETTGPDPDESNPDPDESNPDTDETESGTDESGTDESGTDESGTDESGTDESGTDESGTDESGTDETESGTDEESESDTEDTGNNDECNLNDMWETNPNEAEASIVDWQAVNAWASYKIVNDLYLCPGEDDWYRFETDGLGYGEYWFFVRAAVKEAGLCGGGCDEPVIPAGPMHAMTIDLHRADNLALIGTLTENDGVLKFNGDGGDPFAHDVLLHVYSPTPNAEYPYRLTVEIRNYEGEDECEC